MTRPKITIIVSAAPTYLCCTSEARLFQNLRNTTSRDLSFNHKHCHSLQKDEGVVPAIIHSTPSLVTIWKCVIHKELKTSFMFTDSSGEMILLLQVLICFEPSNEHSILQHPGISPSSNSSSMKTPPKSEQSILSSDFTSS